ncbi:MAG: UDP-N-acetylmuramate dehydrogenase [Fusobacterium sp. JB021]|nr:UDP-N-acetylmuramate dehydrogenase [Fusobacterium sp. JB020]MDP0493088.1 UDP-N-acetylmuramate dehydrogenase [Fusobacterium sp. JB021]MDP0507520.1 UDP-N-acetylmuramate dehydrogenase [Fusobacterium sp. JB019]
MIISKNYNMKKHSNMKIGGKARSFIEIENKMEVLDVVEKSDNFFIIGNGTNTLFNDKFLNIDFISLKKLKKITKIDDFRLNVEAGLDFGTLIKYLEQSNLSGIEELSGIPGTVGGIVYMNGGAYGKEIFDCIESVECLDNKKNIRIINKKDLMVEYRNTEIKEKKWIILSVNFIFEKGFKREIVQEKRNKRNKNHPIEKPNLGSTFKNPKGFFAAKLIIESGLQGKRVGQAQVSMKHPNFIVNNGNASFEDVINLINYVIEEVYKKTGIKLEKEIIILK